MRFKNVFILISSLSLDIRNMEDFIVLVKYQCKFKSLRICMINNCISVTFYNYCKYVTQNYKLGTYLIVHLAKLVTYQPDLKDSANREKMYHVLICLTKVINFF